MFKKLCIRNKIMISVVLLLFLSSGSILLLIDRIEKEIYSSNADSTQLFSYNYFAGMILTGDIHSSFFLNKDYPLVGKDNNDSNLITAVHKLKTQVLIVFGLSIILGIFLSIGISRSISRPIMQLVHASKNLTNGKMGKSFLLPNCAELQVLTDSFKMMQEGFLEHEEEKSRLESVEITKNLAAGIAHEIKNPINTVGLIADYLQTNLSPDNPEKRYEFYKLSENMKNELKRINRIVEGFLKLTRPDIYHFKKVNINSIIQYNVSILEPEAIKHGIKIHLQFYSMLPGIKADRDMLNQVFSNLILNAIEAMPRGGDITITTEPKEGNVEILVSDNGIGIKQENIRKIFSPYYSTKKNGFGLGLSLIHNIIHKHHGKITAHSERGMGTDFIILLPADFSDE